VTAEELQASVRRQLHVSAPFTGAFVGRIGAVVPFLPMCNEDPDVHPLKGEMMTVAKLLIEREQEKNGGGSELMKLNQILTPARRSIAWQRFLWRERFRRQVSVLFK
jgi:hypothetical protein